MNKSFVIALALILALIKASNGASRRTGRRLLQSSKGFSQSEQNTIVNEHNKYRAQIARGEVSGYKTAAKMPALTWSATLASYAQEWTDDCPGASHDPRLDNLGQGQNMAGASGISKSQSITQGIAGWFNEHYDAYQQSNGIITGSFYKIGHFTQLVWDDTTQVGCGYRNCNGEHQMFCNYSPAGNFNMETHPTYTIGSTGSQCKNKRSDGLCDGSGTVSGGGNGGGNGSGNGSGGNTGTDLSNFYCGQNGGGEVKTTQLGNGYCYYSFQCNDGMSGSAERQCL